MKMMKHFISRESVEMILLQSTNEELAMLILFCRYAGLRIFAEAMLLHWDDLDLTTNQIKVRTPRKWVGEKSIIPIDAPLQKSLLEFMKKYPCKDGYVLSKLRELSNGRIRIEIKNLFKLAGEDCSRHSIHDLRSSYLIEQFVAG
jgi:integrase